METPLPGGTAILHGIVWGFSDAVDAIGERSKAPGNLRVAAGLNDVAMIESLFDAAGQMLPAAKAHRAYYRPNYGWFPWQSGDDDQEVLDEALILAATGGRLAAMEALVARGANVSGKAYETNALIRATWKGEVEAVAWLLGAGADVDGTGWLGGHAKGVTSLHIAAADGRLELVDMLLSAGADRSIEDSLYSGTPEGWARQSGHEAVIEKLQAS